MADPIVVATEGEGASLGAARWAVEMAGRLGTGVTALEVREPASAEVSPDDFERFEAEARDALDRRLRDAGLTVQDVQVATGGVRDDLVAASADTSLLVLGSTQSEGVGPHGHFGLAHAIAHHVTSPLVVVPAGDWSGRDRKVVVGIDGSEASRRTLEWAVDFARKASMSVVAAFVVDSIYETFSSGDWLGDEERAARSEAQDPAVELVERYGTDPAEELGWIVEDQRAELLVVGAKDHHSLGGTLLGAIPDELLHHPVCPVCVLPHHLIST